MNRKIFLYEYLEVEKLDTSRLKFLCDYNLIVL